jgi:hypothetical protein
MDELSAYSFDALLRALRHKLSDSLFSDERKAKCAECLDDLDQWIFKPWIAECGKGDKQ